MSDVVLATAAPVGADAVRLVPPDGPPSLHPAAAQALLRVLFPEFALSAPCGSVGG